ncbi:MAG TPA: hypothetical protein VG960_09660 [Caulobacteraceae bacterium]|nr:hypothetical protein [Caulobacteraceae bacterium]
MDIRLYLCAAFVVAGLAWLLCAMRVLVRGSGGAATVFASMGALSLAAVWMMWSGPWRSSDQGLFPMAVLDLSAPPAAIERDGSSH